MINGINGKPYIDLSQAIDYNSFIKLHPKICRGFALGNKSASLGNLEVPDGFMNIQQPVVPLYKLYREFQQLPDDHPIRIYGNGLNYSDLSVYLKFAMNGFDLYSYHFLIDFKEGWRNSDPLHGIQPEAKYFPEVIQWIKRLVEENVFSHIGRAAFFLQEAGGISFEHKDPSVDPEHPEILSEFIHIRINLNRPFYIRDKETQEKIYINTCVAYWNDQDFHGGDTVMEPSYAFRVDGVFTDEFRKNLR